MDINKYQSLSLNFVNTLESFKTKFKALHWSAPQLTYHREIDEFLDDLIEFQDEIAECSQGYIGSQFGVNDIRGTHLPYTDAVQTTEALNQEVVKFYQAIKNDDSLQGIVNIVNDFQQEILETLYLFRLATKDGNNTFVTTKTTSFEGLSRMVNKPSSSNTQIDLTD